MEFHLEQSKTTEKINNLPNIDKVVDDNSRCYASNIQLIREARERINSFIHCTPVLTSSTLDELSGLRLYFKCEFLQKTGSFKARGALNAVSLSNSSSIVTHSSGNHGQGIAWAAKQKGKTAYVVMPNNTPTCKINAVLKYGAKVSICEPTYASRKSAAESIQNEVGASLIHSYDNVDVIAGQGTISLEFLEHIPQLDAIIVPIGGGGLCSGVTLAAKALKPSIVIIAAEPGAISPTI